MSADCASICASYGLEGCTNAAAEASNFCENQRCEVCSSSSPTCSKGVCNQQAHACGIECQADDGACSQCDQCVSTNASSVGTCLPQNSTATCTPASSPYILAMGATPGSTSYLDRFNGRTSIELDSTSSMSFSTDGAWGSGSLSAGSLSMTAIACPGTTCAIRLNDLLARANSIDAHVSVIDFLGFTITKDVSVTDAVITNVRPTTLESFADGSLRVPPHGFEAMVAVTIEGTRNQVRTFNEQDITGSLNFADGTVHLTGTFSFSGVSVTFDLNGHVTNFAPKAHINAPELVECTGVTTPVSVDGTGSSDAPPGPGIAQYRWFTDFDLATGLGTTLASTANPVLNLALGTYPLALLVVDGLGSMGISGQVLTVQDTTAPVIVPSVSQIEVCNPLTHEIALPLPAVIEGCTPDTKPTGEVISINGVEQLPPIPLTDGRGTLRPGTLVVRWTAEDGSGNKGTATQTINVVSRPALYATSSLRINDDDKIQTPGGGWASVVNSASMSAAETNIGVAARVGDVLSRAQVTLRDRSRVEGFLKTLSPLIRQNGTVIVGPLFEAGPVPLPAFPVLSPPTGTGRDVPLEPNQSASLTPGAYGKVTIKSGATLRLSPGAYRFATLDAEPQSKIIVGKAGTPTSIYVSTGDVILRGKFVDTAGATGAPFLGSLGTGNVLVETPFQGAIVAPQGKIVMASSTVGYVGEFAARDIELGPRTPLVFKPFNCSEP
jgi:hypothetical protein